jgi:chemotaxis protein histidine kinase CheA
MAEQEVKITFTIDGIDKEVKSVEELQKEMSKLGKETKKAGEENTIFADAKKKFTDFKAGIKGATAGFKGLKGAIAATGIGLLLTAIASLISYFKNSEEGSRKLAIAMEAMGIIFGKIQDAASKLGEMLVWVFTNPKEALMNFVNLIKENIINRFEGLLKLIPSLGNAISELFKGNFKNAGKIAADAVGQVVLGVENITDKVADATESVIEFGKTVVAEVKEAVDVATKLVDQFRGIRDAQQALIVDNALLNKEMETQQKIAEDTNRTYEERKEALEKVGEAQVKLAENLAEQARLEEANLKLQISQEGNYEKREELETQLAEAVASRIEAETALETRRLDAQKITTELENEEIARKQTIRDKLAEMELEDIENEFTRAQEELALAQQRDLEELERLKATEEEKQKVKEFYTKKSKKLKKEEADFEKLMQKQVSDANLQVASQALGAVSQLVGENTAAGKAAAIAATTIDTYLGAQKAYTSQLIPGDPSSPIRAAIAAGVAVAGGLANVAAIVKTKTPGTSKGGGGGGSTPSRPPLPNFDPSAALGGAAEADQSEETTVTLGEQTGSTGPAIRAYVVSDEMTTQQEADAKINDLARL